MTESEQQELPVLQGCVLTLEYSERVNYAMRQQGTPLVEAVLITNSSDEVFEGGVLRLRLASGECDEWVRTVAKVAPGTAVRVVPDDWKLSPEALGERTEAERTSIEASFQVGESVVERSFELDVLAFDQWPGALHYPEFTAAFVTPNHSQIAELLGRAREILGKGGDSDSLDGYQSASRQRAARIAEVCYTALAGSGVGYINPPASFERTGQRVRLVDRVMREKLGTCLDLSLVLMGMWEQCGLNTLLILPEGHALPAIWTHEASLPETTIDDAARVRNLIELGEIVPVESTFVTKDSVGFERAVEAGIEKLVKPGSMFCAIDLASARKRGVRPLPLRDTAADVAKSADESAAVVEAKTRLDSVVLAERAERELQDKLETVEDEPGGRIERWQSRLLDLSLRNRLLNFRETGRTLMLDVPDLARLEDALSDDGRFEVLPKTDGDDAFRLSELESGRLYSEESPAEAQKRLLTIYRLAKSSIEETGANLLHLALGQLVWYESPSADMARVAPILLLPVKLTRSSGGAGYTYKVSLSDEPIRPNVTLLEKLRTEFGIDTKGLDELPEDDSGIDVPMVLRKFREAIRDTQRWEVRESACIGLFSFNKFLMWRDLRENLESLKENRLVRHLVETPGDPFESEPFPDPSDLDDHVKPGEIYCTRDADSSQLVAVKAASDGRSFVLEGPPGTGKSQTIANMVANALANGKRVLFVAEKMAALSVVRKRLEQDGLGAHCLELHSAKASKKEVLAQLARSLDEPSHGMPGGWDSLCADLGETRDRLNAYVRELHKERHSGESLYEVIGRLADLGEYEPVGLSFENVAETGRERLHGWRAVLQEMRDRAAAVDPVDEHPLRGIGLSEWSFGLNEEVRGVLGIASEAARELSEAVGAFVQELYEATRERTLSRQELDLAIGLAQSMQSWPEPTRELVDSNTSDELRAGLREFARIGRDHDERQQNLLARYQRELLELNHLELIDRAKRAKAQIAPFRWLRWKKLAKQLRPYLKVAAPSLSEMIVDLEEARDLRSVGEKLDRDSRSRESLERYLNGDGHDWEAIDSLLNWCDGFREMIRKALEAGAEEEFVDRIVASVTDRERASGLARRSESVCSTSAVWAERWGDASERLAVTDDGGWYTDEVGYIEGVEAALQRWMDDLESLNTWCSWRKTRDVMCESGLEPLVDAYERGQIGLGEIESVFEHEYGTSWFVATANKVDVIRGFSSDAQDSLVSRFGELDRELIERTKLVVGSKLSGAAPEIPENVSGRSEVGILRRELEKKRRHMPTRRLIASIPSLLPRLKPCFLMSPLSVAQFLDAGTLRFDMVVFDEASQIPVWDAIGAIARGQEVVVVGDSKQLPPTTFFSTIDGDDEYVDDANAVEDMESILKECNASGVPALRLNWHYRSRHESLIAFSNRQYYENALHTFPSPVERSERLGVTFKHVPEGVYDRGGTRTNRTEAEAVVSDVLRMLLEPDANGSIGIVTFNQAQQTLIEDLLDQQRRDHPEIERFFGGGVDESVFVKNLENVQGDERDTIIFSVGYGPDDSGRVSMNFGPLNKEGGERRLNVAVTRAKRRLIVYSSMTADAIDLRRTSAVGVRDFRLFLDFAERGTLPALSVERESIEIDGGVAFESAVKNELEKRGWKVDTRVGYAGYRIDLAVCDPKDPSRYLLGIECDGASYCNASMTRDRDRTRSAVLAGLGWTLHRVWAVQWRISKEACLQEIDEALAIAAEGEGKGSKGRSSSGQSVTDAPRAQAVSTQAGVERDADPDIVETTTEYRVAKRRGRPRDLQDIYSPSADELLVDWLAEIVAVEQPIVTSLAEERLAEWCGRKQINSKFKDRFSEVLNRCIDLQRVWLDQGSLWSEAQVRSVMVRVPGRDAATQRDIEQIPGAEIATAMLQVVGEQFGLPIDELMRETAKLFGVARLTSRVAEILDAGLERLVASGDLVNEAGMIRIPR
ncbi:MAG: DUF3320 domain-containing protein [Phycisphaerales bacterium]